MNNKTVEKIAKQIASNPFVRKYSHTKPPTSSMNTNPETLDYEKELQLAISSIPPENSSDGKKEDTLNLSYSSLEEDGEIEDKTETNKSESEEEGEIKNKPEINMPESEKKKAMESLTNFCRNKYKADGFTKRKLFKIFNEISEFYND